MILFPKTSLQQAGDLLVRLGFHKQHERIYHYLYTEENLRYQCVLGLEEADANQYEVSLSIMKRPVASGKKGIRLEDVAVVDFEDAPQPVQEMIHAVEEQLEQLA